MRNAIKRARTPNHDAWNVSQYFRPIAASLQATVDYRFCIFISCGNSSLLEDSGEIKSYSHPWDTWCAHSSYVGQVTACLATYRDRQQSRSWWEVEAVRCVRLQKLEEEGFFYLENTWVRYLQGTSCTLYVQRRSEPRIDDILTVLCYYAYQVSTKFYVVVLMSFIDCYGIRAKLMKRMSRKYSMNWYQVINIWNNIKLIFYPMKLIKQWKHESKWHNKHKWNEEVWKSVLHFFKIKNQSWLIFRLVF